MQPTDKQMSWQNHIASWQESKLSQTAYCNRHQLKLSTFTYWRHKQAQQSRKFVPLAVTSQSSITISLSGVRIDLAAGQLEAVLPLVLRVTREQA